MRLALLLTHSLDGWPHDARGADHFSAVSAWEIQRLPSGASSRCACAYYAIGLAGYAALKVLVNAFYALDRRKTPMLVSFLAVGAESAAQLDLYRFGWGGGTVDWRFRQVALRPSIS